MKSLFQREIPKKDLKTLKVLPCGGCLSKFQTGAINATHKMHQNTCDYDVYIVRLH